jgi:hypothetical protein
VVSQLPVLRGYKKVKKKITRKGLKGREMRIQGRNCYLFCKVNLPSLMRVELNEHTPFHPFLIHVIAII